MDKMWKRLPRSNKGKENQVNVSSPVLVNSSIGDERLQGYPNVVEAQAVRRFDDESSSLAPLPFRAMPPMDPDSSERVVSHAPSSVYSQQYDWREQEQQSRPPVPSSYYGDVSPPESPKMFHNSTYHSQNDGDVSPIEKDPEADIHPAFRIKQKPIQSPNLPVMRKATPGAGPVISPGRQIPVLKAGTKWDKYSGEPTTNEKRGLPSQVKPGNTLPIRKMMQQRQTPAELAKTKLRSVGERTAHLASKGLTIDTRPPWKGASGRETILDPVSDKPGQQMPKPRRQTEQEQRIVSPASASTSTPTSARRGLMHESETPYASTPQGEVGDEDASRPATAINDNSKSPSAFQSAAYPAGSQSSRQSPDDQHADSGVYDHQPVKPVDGPVPTRSEIIQTMPRKPVHSIVNEDPESRFSWTTTATGTTYQQSPPPSPPPPMPALPDFSRALPSSSTSSTRTGTSTVTSPVTGLGIMNRGRGIPRRDSPESEIISPSPTLSVTSTKRKAVARSPPTDSYEPTHPPRGSSRAPSIASTIGGTKALPQTPKELDSKDHITMLQAQQDDFANQRANVQRVLRDLLKPGASNPLTTDFRAEREREKRILNLREELSEINRSDHEVGIKLTRALKRRERDEGGAGTALWIKRVTT